MKQSFEKQGILIIKSFLLQEGPHCMIPEDEFYDAVDATLDKLEKEDEKVCTVMCMCSYL